MRFAQRQSGFSLIAAIFLLVVIAGLVVYLVNIRTVQQITLVYGVQGARASQAARAGLEWGINQAIGLNSCNAVNPIFSVAAPSLNSFTINVSCRSSEHTEAVTDIVAYQITAEAYVGLHGSLDYVFRRMQATVSAQPP